MASFNLINLIKRRYRRITKRNMSEFIYDNVEAPILILDKNYNIVVINKFSEKFLGINESDIKDYSIEDFFDIDKEDITNKVSLSEINCKTNNAVCSLSVSRLKDRKDEIFGYIVFVVDQTESVKAMRQVEESRKMAEDANKAKSEFLANMSHEIRTPINVIIGMDEMILRETKDRQLVKYASDIKLASNSLLSLVNDILDVSKIESGKMEIISTEYETREFLLEIVTAMSFKAREKGLKFVFNIDEKLPKLLYGDDVHIRQIMNNLLSNAIKYTAKGQVIFSVDCYMIDRENVDIQVAVTDTGCGIKKEDIHKLFDAFTRVDERNNRTIEGTGLGLKITKELLDMMGGVLDVKSIYGRGSTFSCSFRQKIVNGEAIGDFNKYYENHQNTSYIYSKTFEAPSASILVVDDNQMNLNVVDNLLKDTKMNIVTVLSGQAAVESARNNKYDIIFMDHMMPVMDGFEAFTAIKEDEEGLNKDTPIIAMTANAISGARQVYRDYGFAEYISKPVDPSKLNDVITSFVDSDKIQYVNAKISDLESGEGESKEMKRIQRYLEDKGINAIAGLRNVNNKILNYQETLRMFVKGYKEKRATLQKLLDDDMSKEYGIEAHALKANARIIGAEEFSSLCYIHEMAGKEFRLDQAKKSWKELVSEWSKLVDIINSYLREIDFDREEVLYDASKLKSIGEEELGKLIDEIKELIEDYEHHEAKDKIELLMDYKLPDDIKEAVKEAYKYLDRVDYVNAAKAMENV